MPNTLTPRNRLLQTINHCVPDRVPIDLGGFQSGIHRQAYQNLLDYLGIKDQSPALLDSVQQLAVPCEDLLRRLRVDTRYLSTRPPACFTGKISLHRRDGKLWHDLRDEFGVVWSMPDDQGLYMDISHHPLAEMAAADLADLAAPDGADPTRFVGVRQRAQRLRQETEVALCTTIGGSMYEYSWYQRGLERWLIDTLENPDFCRVSLERMLRFWKGYYSGYMAEVGDLVDVVQIGDDLAGQWGPLVSPEFYRKYVKPCLQELIRHIRSLSRARIWYHTCGACRELIPDLIESGVDILNPVQISANAMEPSALKAAFGKKLAFWGGGCDSQRVLPFARPEEIRAHVRPHSPAQKRLFPSTRKNGIAGKF